ncbi:MAG: LysE family transporter [Cytophagaceae bacterium]|nr:LysE family transporter [Cytophagaceae bacterium]
METVLPIFAITFLISFVASAQPGVINLSVIQTTLQRGLVAGFWLAAGGCVPELVYGGLVAYGSQWFSQMPGLQHTLKLIAIPALLLLGILALLRSRRPKSVLVTEADTQMIGRTSFVRGLTLAFLNPQLPLFWFFVLVYFSNYPWLRVTTLGQQLAFGFGASLGAFSVLMLYARLVYHRREKLSRYLQPHRFDLVMGCSFIGLALWRVAAWWL